MRLIWSSKIGTKRLAFAMLAVMLLLPAIAACGGGDDDDATATATTSNVASPTAASAATATTATSGGTPTGAATTAAPTATEQPAPSATPTEAGVDVNEFAYGFNIAWRGDAEGPEFNKRTVETVQEAGFDWVRIQIYWDEVQRAKDWLDPLPIDQLVANYEGSGVHILATVSKAPEWAKDPSGAQLLADWADWQEFMRFMAERYKGTIDAWELWNEPNHAITVGGNVRVEDYAHLLESGYNGVKAGNPNALVVFAGLTPTGVNDPSIAINDLDYLRSFYQFEDGRYAEFFDVLGAHANATNNPPDTLFPDNPGTGNWSQDSSFYFRRTELLHGVMDEFNDTRPVWVTEFGWSTANQAPGYEYGVDNTAEEQAQYLVQAFVLAHGKWSWCKGMFVWNLNYSVVVDPSDEKYPWAVLNGDWSPRPAFTALQEMVKT